MALRNILVSGTSSGIGLATAYRLLEQGHRVLGIARRAAPIKHPSFIQISIDLTAPNAHQQLQHIARQHPSIDALISIAGGGQFGCLENFSPMQIAQSIAQNLTSHLLLARAFISTLKTPAPEKNTRRNIIFMGSEAALTGSQQGSLYSAAKFGLRGFTQALRQECASRNVHVGIINPGMVRSAFFDQQTFSPGPDEQNALSVDDVVDAITLMLNANNNAVIDEINLSPLKHVVSKKPVN